MPETMRRMSSIPDPTPIFDHRSQMKRVDKQYQMLKKRLIVAGTKVRERLLREMRGFGQIFIRLKSWVGRLLQSNSYHTRPVQNVCSTENFSPTYHTFKHTFTFKLFDPILKSEWVTCVTNSTVLDTILTRRKISVRVSNFCQPKLCCHQNMFTDHL